MPFPTYSPNHVYRDHESQGLPSSGYHKPYKPEIRQLLNEIQDAIIALIAGQGGNITLPNLVIPMTITGGTANAITATPDRTPPTSPAAAFFLMIATQANTGPVTINGKPLRTTENAEITAGDVAKGEILLFVDMGDHYRLVMNPAPAGLVQFDTWARLSEIMGSKAGAPGRVLGPDTGTHIDPVTGEEVPNEGEFSWSIIPAGWHRIGEVNYGQLQAGVDYLLRVVRDRLPTNGFWPRPWAVTDEAGMVLIAVNAETGLAEIVTNDMPGGPLLDPTYRHLIADPSGRLILGVKWSGGVTLGTDPLVDSDYQKVETDENGTIIRGHRYDGSIDDSGFRGYATVYTKGSEGARHVYLFADGIERRISFGFSDNFAPQLSVGVIRFLSRSGDDIEVRTVSVKDTLPFSSSVTDVYLFLGLGQSLESGITTTAITAQPPLPSRLVMFNGGVLTLGNPQNTVNLPDVLPDANIVSLEPAYSRIQEAPVLQTGNNFLREMGVETGAVVGTYSIGGTGIEGLGPGSVPFSNLLKGVTRQAEMISITGRTFTPVVPFSQGEHDNGRPTGWYKPRLISLQAALTANINAATGHSGEVVMILGQIASFTDYGRSFSPVPLGPVGI